jgi:lysophospholipase L1-like esterase
MLQGPFEVRLQCQAQWFGMVDQAADGYESLIRADQPDVVVIAYGINECMPRVVPNRLTDHLLDWNRRRGRVRDLYRGRFLPRVWPGVRWVQRKAAARLGLRTWRMTPYRFEQELRRLVGAVREDLHALVVVIAPAPPTEDILWLLPHLDERRDVYARLIARVVESYGDGVRLVDPATLFSECDDAAVPDGIHFSAEAHQQVAKVLTSLIEEWAAAHRPLRSAPGS